MVLDWKDTEAACEIMTIKAFRLSSGPVPVLFRITSRVVYCLIIYFTE